MNRAERRRRGKPGSGKGTVQSGRRGPATVETAGEAVSGGLLEENLLAVHDLLWEAAHDLAANKVAMKLGVSKATEFPTVAVQIGDDKGHELAAEWLPADRAVDALEEIADMLEGHGYGPVPRKWREEYPQAWAAVRLGHEADLQGR